MSGVFQNLPAEGNLALPFGMTTLPSVLTRQLHGCGPRSRGFIVEFVFRPAGDGDPSADSGWHGLLGGAHTVG